MRITFVAVVIIGAAIGFVLAEPRSGPGRVAPIAAAGARTTEAPRRTVLDRAENGHFYAVADVNGEPIRFMVDTGATLVALTPEDARRAHIPFDPSAFRVVGRGAAGAVSGQPVTIRMMALDGKHAEDVRAVVLADSSVSLLGQSYLRQLGSMSVSGDSMTLE